MTETIWSSFPPEAGLPRFRESELLRLVDVLGRLQPAVLLVCGSAGMGKTILLRDLEARASRQGWHVVSDLAETALRIEPQTTARRYREAVLEALAREPSLGGGGRSAHDAAVVDRFASSHRLDPFLEQLARKAPVLLVADSYRPGTEFAQWFENVFLAQVPQCGAAVAVAIGHRPGGDRLVGLATEYVELDELAEEDARLAIARTTAHVEPPLTDAELDVYAAEARTPLMIVSLVRALTFPGRESDGQPR